MPKACSDPGSHTTPPFQIKGAPFFGAPVNSLFGSHTRGQSPQIRFHDLVALAAEVVRDGFAQFLRAETQMSGSGAEHHYIHGPGCLDFLGDAVRVNQNVVLQLADFVVNGFGVRVVGDVFEGVMLAISQPSAAR